MSRMCSLQSKYLYVDAWAWLSFWVWASVCVPDLVLCGRCMKLLVHWVSNTGWSWFVLLFLVKWEIWGSLDKCSWSWRWECSCRDTSGHWGFWDTQLMYFFPPNKPVHCRLDCGAHWSAQHRLVSCLLLLCCLVFFHTWIRFSFRCRIYSMNVVDSSISRPSSASPSGKPSGPAVSMGSVQGHYVQQVLYPSSLYSPKIALLPCSCVCALGCRGEAARQKGLCNWTPCGSRYFPLGRWVLYWVQK